MDNTKIPVNCTRPIRDVVKTVFPSPNPNKKFRYKIIAGLFVIFLFILGAFLINRNSSVVGNPEIKSGLAGYCLDDHHGAGSIGTPVDSWRCNGTNAQDWIVSANTIKHNGVDCLSVQNNGKSTGAKVVLSKCNNTASQTWKHDLDGYENPASGLCLSTLSQTSGQIGLESCDNITHAQEAWMSAFWGIGTAPKGSCRGSEGQKVACNAEKQYALWQANPSNHKALLNNYSDGNGYEEWCADFISYIYKQAGHPFRQGERSGWDEYDANNLQYLGGFSKHSATNFQPKPGDIAVFNYSGGHVELVVSGGKSPTFIYGDSGTVDPNTGNGEMEENTVTNDGASGRLIYYLSPY